MRSGKVFAALGLALIICVFLAACGGGGSKPVPNAPVLATSTLPPGAVNSPYSSGVGVQRGTGTPPFTWSITSGSLPAGLSLNTSNQRDHWNSDNGWQFDFYYKSNGLKLPQCERDT